MNNKTKVSHIAIVGAGQLGSRHLQGLAQLDCDIVVDVMDPDVAALALARKRFDEMSPNQHKHSVRYINTQKDLKNNIDLAIIATNADVRPDVIKTLLTNVYVKYLILEKVVFQSIRDFETVIQILDEKGVKAWVNCPRRIIPFFRTLREKTITANKVQIIAKGSKWGMASNAIHMLDLLAFLTGQTDISIDETRLDHKIYESNRSGFLELGGKLLAETENGDTLVLRDDRNQNISLIISIHFNGFEIEIDQILGQVIEYSEDHQEKSLEKAFIVPLQSELTGFQVKEILQTGNSQLTSLKESYALHKPMLKAFNIHLSKLSGVKNQVCPIT